MIAGDPYIRAVKYDISYGGQFLDSVGGFG
jgi:hypothetical protein